MKEYKQVYFVDKELKDTFNQRKLNYNGYELSIKYDSIVMTKYANITKKTLERHEVPVVMEYNNAANKYEELITGEEYMIYSETKLISDDSLLRFYYTLDTMTPTDLANILKGLSEREVDTYIYAIKSLKEMAINKHIDDSISAFQTQIEDKNGEKYISNFKKRYRSKTK